jgi:hypothetical protein
MNRTSANSLEPLRLGRLVADFAFPLAEASRITAKPEKDSVDQRNVAITKTIRAAMADIKISR